ncbi:hypothetical protein M885DRAFT_539735, partial [Pelagophyceae sp. CCMP2097]
MDHVATVKRVALEVEALRRAKKMPAQLVATLSRAQTSKGVATHDDDNALASLLLRDSAWSPPPLQVDVGKLMASTEFDVHRHFASRIKEVALEMPSFLEDLAFCVIMARENPVRASMSMSKLRAEAQSETNTTRAAIMVYVYQTVMSTLALPRDAPPTCEPPTPYDAPPPCDASTDAPPTHDAPPKRDAQLACDALPRDAPSTRDAQPTPTPNDAPPRMDTVAPWREKGRSLHRAPT